MSASHRAVKFDANREAKSSVWSSESRTRVKLGGQKLQDIAFAMDQNDRLPVTNEVSRSTLWRAKRSLAFYLASSRLFLACTARLRNV